jgi:hypothetical protein
LFGTNALMTGVRLVVSAPELMTFREKDADAARVPQAVCT